MNEKKVEITGSIKPVEITEEIKKSYLDYAMSVIVARALPDVRDGLKPVHRRILYAMQQIGLSHTSRFTKSAKVVGEVLGKYHPHGDIALYDALVRLAQDFSMRYPLITGQGNFGSIDGDSPAAMRYTEVKLAPIAQEMLADIEKDTVEFMDNFDASLKEPVFLPAKIPNLLLMGSDGIAVGMATKIPPHNLNEVVDALIYIIENGKVITAPNNNSGFKKIKLADEDPSIAALSATFESEATIEDLMRFIKGPDFPTSASIYNRQDIILAYTTGRGKILIQAEAVIEEGKGDRFQIIIKEIPYQVNKASLVSKIAYLIKEKKIEGISDLRDESNRQGIRIVLELKKSAKPKAILANLYKYTAMRTSFPVNMVALIDGTPQLLNLKQILLEFLKYRQKTVTRRTIFELKAARQKAHILEGLKIALDHLDAVIQTIKKSKDVDDARKNLMTKFNLSDIQANAILEMQLRRLAALERKKIEDEYKEVMAQIEYLTGLLMVPRKILTIIKKELEVLKEKYGDPRKTKVFAHAIEDFSPQDLIPKETCLIALTKSGYIKRLPTGTYHSQKRGGRGVTGMATKEEDEILQFVTSSTHDSILFFTNKGRVFSNRAWEITEGSRQSKGQAVINLINQDQDEKIQTILPINTNKKSKGYLVMTTKQGNIKKTSLDKFYHIRVSGIIAIKLDKGDELCWVKPTTGNNDILLVSHNGKSIRFRETNLRSLGRDTKGVKGIELKKSDWVVGVEIFDSNPKKPSDRRRKFFQDVLVVMEKGLGKRTPIKEHPLQKRAGVGVKVANITNKTGKIVCCQLVNQDTNQVILTSKKAQVIKLPLRNIPRLGRDTQGVILMRFSKEGDSIAAVTCLQN